MSIARLATLKEQRRAALARGHALTTGDGQLTAEQLTALDAINLELDGLDSQITAVENLLRREQASADAVAAQEANSSAPGRGGHLSSDPREAAEQEVSAFRSWMMHGAQGLGDRDAAVLHPYRGTTSLSGANAATQTVGTNSAGGYFVPAAAAIGVELAIRSYAPILDLFEMVSVDHLQELPYVTADDNVTAEWLTETASTNEANFTVASTSLKSYRLSTKKIPVSLDLLFGYAMSNPGGIEQFIFDIAGKRIGRQLAQSSVSGDGTNKMTGFLPGTSLGKTSASATLPTWEDLVDLRDALELGYANAPGAAYVINRLALSKIRWAKDSTGRPLFVPGEGTGSLAQWDGKPIVAIDEMPSIAVNAKIAAFGNFKSYKFRKRSQGMLWIRNEQPYQTDGYIVFVGFDWFDGKVINPGVSPLVHLKMAAS